MQIELSDIAYITETTVTIRQTRRRTTVPKEIAERFALEDGDRLRWVLKKDGTVFLVKS